MKFLTKCLSVLMVGCLLPFAVHASDTQVFRLLNGMSVLIREDSRFPLVSVRLFVRAGSAWERPEEAGMSHLLEHMVFKGSATSGEGVDKLVENAGGSMNAYTAYDMTTYLTDLPSAQWKQAMKAVRDLAFDPLLRQADLDAELEVVIAEMKQRGDNPSTKLFLAALGNTLKGTPYEFPVIGNEKTLRAMTPDMLRNYIARRYDPRDMVLCIVGDVHAQEVLAEACSLMGGYSNKNVYEKPERYAPERLARGFSADVQAGPWKKAFAALSFPIADANDAMQPALDVLCALLDSEETSLLQRELRIKRQVVDSVSATPMAMERAGALLFTAQADEGRLSEFLQIIGEKLRVLKGDDFSDEELARVKLNIEDSYLRGLEKIASIAERTGSEYFYDPESVGGEKYLSAVRSVGKEELQRVIDAWLRPEALSLTALVPEHAGGKHLDSDELKAALAKGWPEIACAELKAGRSGKASAEKPEVLDLGGGCTLALLPDSTLPYVSASLVFTGGELLAPDDSEGLAALTASALTTGTKSRDYASLSSFLAGRAASLSAGSGTRTFGLNADAPKRFASEVLALLKETLEEPAFREPDVARVRHEQCAAITSSQENAMGVVGRNLRRFLYKSGAYAHRSLGEIEKVRTYSREDIAAFWRKQLSQPWALSVAGDFDRAEIMRFAESLPKPSAVAVKAEPPAWNEDKKLEIRLPGRDQAVYLMVFPAVGSESPDRQPLRLLSAVLDGFTGRLYQELREKQSLGYSVFPVDWADKKTGFFGFGIIAAPQNLEKARQSFVKLAKALQEEEFAEEALVRAKAVAEANYYKARQSRASRAAEGAGNALENRPLDYGWQKLEEMKRANAKDLVRVARMFLDVQKAYELTVKP